MATIVVGSTPQRDDTVNDGAELHRIFGKQIHRLIAETRQCLATVLTRAPFGQICEAVGVEEGHKPVHISGRVSVPKLGLGYIDRIYVVHRGYLPPPNLE